MKRRHFLHASAATAAPFILPSGLRAQGASDRPPPSGRITVGVVGLGGMGMGNLNGFLHQDDVQVVAVCDVDEAHHRDQQSPGAKPPGFGREPARLRVDEHYAREKRSGSGSGCAAYADFRELCARDDIDAVVVATPDHWHALCTLEALRSGKDVYCEKPVTHLFAEGQAVYREAARRGAVFQTGSQQRSDVRFRIAVEVVLNGLLGPVRQVEVGLPTGPAEPRHEAAFGEPPAHLDYDFWCGPAPALPYHPARVHRNWRWHLAFGGGNLMDWIGHHNDIAHWGLGIDHSGPTRVEAVDWTFPESDLYNGPVHYEIRCEYAGRISSSISDRHPMGTKWLGDDGWVRVDRGKLEASTRDWIREAFDRGPVKAYVSRDHRRNFLDSIRSREPCIAPAETAHRSITPGHLGFVSQALGRPLRWDAASEAVIDDPEADQLLKNVDYRGDWALGAT